MHHRAAPAIAAFVLAPALVLACGRIRYDAARDATTGSDSDGDGVDDARDVCPATPDPSQHDEDGDSRGDACDGCPHLPSVSVLDADADGVEDACDPSGTAGNRRVAFLSFESMPEGWMGDVEPPSTLTLRIEDDALVLGAVAGRVGHFRSAGPATSSYTITTAFTLESVAPAGPEFAVRNVGIVDHVVGMAGTEDALLAIGHDQIDDPELGDLRLLVLEGGTNLGSINFPEPEIPSVLEVGRRAEMTYTRAMGRRTVRFVADGIDVSTSGDFVAVGGDVGLRIRGLTARFEYLYIVE